MEAHTASLFSLKKKKRGRKLKMFISVTILYISQLNTEG